MRLVSLSGLSPRVRGNLPEMRTTRFASGSIPASAGEPQSEVGVVGVSGVYPRECGGTKIIGTLTVKPDGLSPRVRGNHVGISIGVWLGRSIPASAGEPTLALLRRFKGQVYPRECGGTRKTLLDCRPTGGLSPRVRGNHDCP